MNALDFRVKKPTHPAAPMIPPTNELWPINLTSTPLTQVQPSGLRLLSCAPTNGNPALRPYTDYLSYLLGGRLHHLFSPEKDAVTAVQRAARHNDLIILDEPEQSFAARLCLGRPSQKFVAQLPTSVLVARQPLWPLRRLLLVLRMDGGDETAVSWTKRLAHASESTVTILPLVPAMPAMYAPQLNGAAVLLSSQTATGQQLRQVTRQLDNAQVTAVIHLRQGEPIEQIRSEVEAVLYDLVLIGAEPKARWQRWLLGNLVSPLLNWLVHPVLVAR